MREGLYAGIYLHVNSAFLTDALRLRRQPDSRDGQNRADVPRRERE
jgi:hypothetical protein